MTALESCNVPFLSLLGFSFVVQARSDLILNAGRSLCGCAGKKASQFGQCADTSWESKAVTKVYPCVRGYVSACRVCDEARLPVLLPVCSVLVQRPGR